MSLYCQDNCCHQSFTPPEVGGDTDTYEFKSNKWCFLIVSLTHSRHSVSCIPPNRLDFQVGVCNWFVNRFNINIAVLYTTTSKLLVEQNKLCLARSAEFLSTQNYCCFGLKNSIISPISIKGLVMSNLQHLNRIMYLVPQSIPKACCYITI